MAIVTKELIAYLVKNFKLDWYGLHGLSHWIRVYNNGVYLSERTVGADQEVVALFGFLHDACREHDDVDDDHGSRASELVEKLNGKLFEISNEQLTTLSYACLMHNKGVISFEPTIGVCWDSDRLELPRVGIEVIPKFLSTQAAKDYLKAIK